jgi:nucleotide-binding universal stress UspA family protein
MLAIHSILHATDFSEHSEYAFKLASALARDYGAKLLILHVIDAPVPLYAEIPITPDPLEIEEEARRKLHELEVSDGKAQVERRVTTGDPPDEILRAAEESGCDLIVLGTHGRTGLGRLLMGSVAEHVIRKASCPVLTVRVPFAPSTPDGEFAHAGKGCPEEAPII